MQLSYSSHALSYLYDLSVNNLMKIIYFLCICIVAISHLVYPINVE